MTDPSPTLDRWLDYIHPDRLGGALLLLLVFLFAGKILSSLVKRAVDALIARDTDNRIDRLTASFFEQLTRVFVWAFVLMIYAHTIPVLARLSTALLTSVSIASAVLGLAAQSTLANLIAGIGLIFYRPFSLGDRLELATPAGAEVATVEKVSLGYTILCTDDHRRVIISNSTIANTTMLNLTQMTPATTISLPFTIARSADIDQARAIATDLAQPHAKSTPTCPVTKIGPASVELTLQFQSDEAGRAAELKQSLLEDLKKRFDADNIELA